MLPLGNEIVPYVPLQTPQEFIESIIKKKSESQNIWPCIYLLLGLAQLFSKTSNKLIKTNPNVIENTIYKKTIVPYTPLNREYWKKDRSAFKVQSIFDNSMNQLLNDPLYLEMLPIFHPKKFQYVWNYNSQFGEYARSVAPTHDRN